MLTAFQCDVVAYIGDGDVYCPACAVKRSTVDGVDPERVDVDGMFVHFFEILDPEVTGLSPVIRYTAEDEWPGGLYCGDCGDEITKPAEDYCTVHEDWRDMGVDGEPVSHCSAVKDYGDEECSFPDTVDPNPPVPRWVPCRYCGARDGERHRDTCAYLIGGGPEAGGH